MPNCNLLQFSDIKIIPDRRKPAVVVAVAVSGIAASTYWLIIDRMVTHLHGRRRAGLSSGHGRQARLCWVKLKTKPSSRRSIRIRLPFGSCFHASISLQLKNGISIECYVSGPIGFGIGGGWIYW